MSAEAMDRDVEFLDAPVARTLGPAEKGERLIFAGGPRETLGLERETPLEALIGGPVTAPFLAGKRENFNPGEYEAAFPRNI